MASDLRSVNPNLMDPKLRIKELCSKANVDVDDGVPIKRYWRSGKELLKMATIWRDENQFEKAFILYMKYITIFIEKLPQHVEYKISDQNERANSVRNCKAIIPIAEGIKKKLEQKYQIEYDLWLKEKERKEAELTAKQEQLRDEENRRKAFEEAQRLIELQSRIEDARERQQQNDYQFNQLTVNLNHIDIPTNQTFQSNQLKLPPVDRTTKPQDHYHYELDDHQFKQDDHRGSELTTVIVPRDLIDKFLHLAKTNTENSIETCAILAGKFLNSQNSFLVTHVLVPSQKGTSDSCQTDNEEKVFLFQDEHDLITLGWIHTHPTQSAFMSSIDLHTHCSYQLMLPEAIAIVCSPKYNQIGCYSLTPTYGLNFISGCKQTGFHPHPKEPIIYDDSSHIQWDQDKKVQLIDLR